MDARRRRRGSLGLIAILALIIVLPSRASAIGDWDPDDVASPLDLRWFAGRYEDFDVVLTINFWDPVRNRRFPRPSRISHHGLTVRRGTGEFGHIYRKRNGTLWFIWDEVTPTIPQHVPVVRLSPSMLRIRFVRIHPGPYVLRAVTVWRTGDLVVRDRAVPIELGPPPDS